MTTYALSVTDAMTPTFADRPMTAQNGADVLMIKSQKEAWVYAP